MSKIGNIRVDHEGPEDARILIVGEAPGADEEREGRPFIGRAGQFLERYLGRAGLQRSDVYLANLCQYRPKGNKFHHLIGSEALAEGLGVLSETIQRIQPNIIFSLGAWPMYYITGNTAQSGKMGTGVHNWRGSVVPAFDDYIPGIAGMKTLITLHPAYIIRPQGFGYHPLFHLDLLRGVKEAKTPEIFEPKYDEYINPPNVWDIVEDMLRSDWLTVDIETFGNSLACIGITDSVSRGLCITFESPFGWEPAIKLLESPARKIFQYGTFDINYLWKFYGIEVNNFAFDTYIAAANLMPEFPRGLDFLASIYTKFPFYKEERKIWKNQGDLTSLWRYNIKDIIATHEIAFHQMRELKELYG